MQVLDREDAIAAWRRAEARVYPSVMVNAELYQQYIGVVRAVAEELRDVRTEDDLVVAWAERRDLVRAVVSRSAPPMLALMDQASIRDAAFCHRHREITREQGKALAAERLERARIVGGLRSITAVAMSRRSCHAVTRSSSRRTSESSSAMARTTAMYCS